MKIVKGLLISIISLSIVYLVICFFAPKSFIIDTTNTDLELLKNKKKTINEIPFLERGFYLFRYEEKIEE